MMTRRLRCAALLLGLGLIFGAAPVSAGENPRGLPGCPNPLTDWTNCHIADLSHPALESTTVVGGPRVAENVVPASTNPVRLCWLGHYAGRVGPAVADESFQIRIFNEGTGLPDLQEGPIFTWVFHQGGVPGVDRLEMSCLDGQPCPGVGDPAEGGIMAYSVEFSGGFPMIRTRCYWIEIANVGSSGAGVAWSWSGSTYGVDNRTLQNIDGVYGVCGRRSHDRAICISGGVDPFLGTCFAGLPPPPPICELNGANGQLPLDFCDFTSPRIHSRSSSPGSTGGAMWTPALLADNFRFAQDRAVSGLCIFGEWHCPSGDEHCVLPESIATWDIVYYADAGGVPGGEIASFRVGSTPGVTYLWDGDTIASIEHPPVSFQAGECYWLSVGRVQSAAGHQWAWSHTLAGDAGDGSYATNVNGRWHRTRLPGEDGAVVSNLAFLLNAGPVVSPACEPRDCNSNGTPDVDDIAANPALDCYNPAGAPGAMGGPDGALDTCQCIADWTRDGAVNSGDISGFLTSWLGAVNATSTDADFDCSGATSSSDISAFLTAWLASLIDPAARGCP